jgi:hypothetical protein
LKILFKNSRRFNEFYRSFPFKLHDAITIDQMTNDLKISIVSSLDKDVTNCEDTPNTRGQSKCTLVPSVHPLLILTTCDLLNCHMSYRQRSKRTSAKFIGTSQGLYFQAVNSFCDCCFSVHRNSGIVARGSCPPSTVRFLVSEKLHILFCYTFIGLDMVLRQHCYLRCFD